MTLFASVEASKLSRSVSPSSLLSAERELVPFYGRDEELANLQRWCDTSERISLRLLVAPGGHGKTRTARELGHRVRAEGWRSGFLVEKIDRYLGHRDFVQLVQEPTPLLIIVDYADRRTGDLRWLLSIAGDLSRNRIRLLLLARSSGDWLTSVTELLPDTRVSEQGLPPLPREDALRRLWYQKAARAFSRALNLADRHGVAYSDEGAEPVDLLSAQYDSPLGIEVAALLSILSREADEAGLDQVKRIDFKVELYRRILDAEMGDVRSSLADALVEQGVGLERRGSNIVASSAFDEAVNLYRALSREDRSRYTPELVRALNLAAVPLSNLGRSEEADAVTREAIRLEREVDASTAADTPDQQQRLALSLLNRSEVLRGRGRPTEAIEAAREALDTYGRLATNNPVRYRPLVAQALNNLASQLRDVGDMRQAIDVATAAVDVNRRLADDRPNEFLPVLAESLLDLAINFSTVGDRSRAETAAAEARSQLAEIVDSVQSPDRSRVARTYYLMGIANQFLDRTAEAEVNYLSAIEMYENLGENQDLAVAAHQFGNMLHGLGRFEEAENAYRRALEIYSELNDKPSLSRGWHQLGILAQRLGRFDEATDDYRRALDLSLELGDRHSAASSYHQLGTIAQQRGQHDESEAHFQRALGIYLEYNDLFNAASTYHQLGIAAQGLGHYDDAIARYNQALEFYLESGLTSSAAATYHQLGSVALELRRFDEAKASYHRSLELSLERSDKVGAARTYQQLAVVDGELGQLAEAERNLRNALQLYRDAGDHRQESISASFLGAVLMQQDRHSEAVESLLLGATIWRDRFGTWDVQDLRLLRSGQATMGSRNFEESVRNHVPEGLQRELLDALVGDLGDAGNG